MVELKSQIQMIPVNDIKPNDYNPNFQPQTTFDSLMDNIKKNGFYGAIIINKKNIIIDGEHRWRALKALGVKQIPCILESEADDNLSKILTLRLNRERGYLVPVETGHVLTMLSETIPPDILSQTTNIPLDELQLLTNLKYDPQLQEEAQTESKLMWNNVETLVTSLCDRIKASGHGFDRIYTKSRGGLIPARLVADKLGIAIIEEVKEGIKGGLFIDDIYDSGKTYKKYGKGMTLCGFLHLRKDQKVPENVVYGRETDDDTYVVYPWDKHEFNRSKQTKKRLEA